MIVAIYRVYYKGKFKGKTEAEGEDEVVIRNRGRYLYVDNVVGIDKLAFRQYPSDMKKVLCTYEGYNSIKDVAMIRDLPTF